MTWSPSGVTRTDSGAVLPSEPGAPLGYACGRGVHLDQANAYLENEYLAWWNQTLVVKPADTADAHRPLGKEHDLAAILSHVEQRQVTNDYTVRYEGKLYPIDRHDIGSECAKDGCGSNSAWTAASPCSFKVVMCGCAAARCHWCYPKRSHPRHAQRARSGAKAIG